LPFLVVGWLIASPRQDSKTIFSGLADLVCEIRPVAISCRLEWALFREFADTIPLLKRFRDPYFFLFYALIAQIALLAADFPRYAGTQFMFDDQNDIGRNVAEWYPSFLERCSPELLAILSAETPKFENEKTVLPLQAADMFAWYQRRSAVAGLGQEPHRRIWQRFNKFQYSTVIDEFAHLRKIAETLEILE
jgi:hypothetical protein